MWLEKEILKNKKLGVILCDAGGTFHTISLLKEFKIKPNFYCEGPSLEILKLSKPKKSLKQFISDNDLILTSNSWSSDVELRAIKEAKNQRKKVFTILDHVVNFDNRFILKGELLLPDSIILFEKESFMKANEIFKAYDVNLYQCKSNYFLNKFLNELKITSPKKNFMLYIDEPIKDHYEKILKKKFEYRGFDEFTGMNLFMKKIKETKFEKFNIDIKIHPSSKVNKYDYLSDTKIKILNPKIKLESIISAYNYVVGYESMALYLATKIEPKINVYSIIPPYVKDKNIFKLDSFYDL